MSGEKRQKELRRKHEVNLLLMVGIERKSQLTGQRGGVVVTPASYCYKIELRGQLVVTEL